MAKVHQNAIISTQKSKKFLGRGIAHSPDPTPTGEGVSPPHLGASNPRLRRGVSTLSPLGPLLRNPASAPALFDLHVGYGTNPLVSRC